MLSAIGIAAFVRMHIWTARRKTRLGKESIRTGKNL